jgi:hypothetical protein
VIISLKRKDKTKSDDEKPEAQDNNTNEEKWYRSFWVWICETTYFTDWLIVIVTTVIAYVGFLQYKMLDISQKQYSNSQRAFVIYDHTQAMTIGDPKTSKTQKIILFTFFQNSGATPTQNLRIRVDAWKSKCPMPDNFTFPNTEYGQEVRPILPPHANNSIAAITIPIDDIVNINKSPKILYYYVYGWVKYNDILGGNESHISEFCIELDNVWGNYTEVGKDLPTFNYKYCTKHNCADHDCDNQ